MSLNKFAPLDVFYFQSQVVVSLVGICISPACEPTLIDVEDTKKIVADWDDLNSSPRPAEE